MKRLLPVLLLSALLPLFANSQAFTIQAENLSLRDMITVITRSSEVKYQFSVYKGVNLEVPVSLNATNITFEELIRALNKQLAEQGIKITPRHGQAHSYVILPVPVTKPENPPSE